MSQINSKFNQHHLWNTLVAWLDTQHLQATMGFSPTQKAMAIAPKFTGFLSICSSTFIIFYVLRDRKRRNLTVRESREKLVWHMIWCNFWWVFVITFLTPSSLFAIYQYHRLLLGMSMSDFVGSMMCFLSTWPIPRGEAYLAVGTVQTCAAAVRKRCCSCPFLSYVVLSFVDMMPLPYTASSD